ncbi:MAG: PEP-CTERM sorting domain-containing protein [Planctomycetota bacterium]
MKSPRFSTAHLLAAACSITLATPLALADEFEWTGLAGNDDFFDAGNWVNITNPPTNPLGFPFSEDTVRFTTDATLLITFPATVSGMTITSPATVTLGGNRPFSINSSTVNNAGTLTFLGDPSTGVDELLGVSGLVTFTGGGEIVLAEADDSKIVGSSSLLTNAADHTIRGQGDISVEVKNQGLIRAEGGVLAIDNVDNTGGAIEVASGATLASNTSSALSVSGGTLTADAGGRVGGNFSDITFDGTTVGAFGSVDPLSLAGTINNTGTITYLGQTDTPANEVIEIRASVNLTGGGDIVLLEADDSFIEGADSVVLTNTDNTIRGQGQIDVQVTNNSTIRAEGGVLSLADTDNTNGTLEVASDATLGTITVPFSADSLFTVSGGTLTAEAGGRVGGNFSDLTLEGTVTSAGGSAGPLRLAGTINNTGTITYVGETNQASNEVIEIRESVNLTGGGDIVLLEADDSRIDGVGSAVLTNTDNTIRGQGVISLDVVNLGTIRAEGGTLTTGVINNTNGNVQVASDGKLVSGESTADGSGISGGTVTSEGIVNGNLNNVTLADTALVDGTFQLPNGRDRGLSLSGTINNTGTISFANASPGATDTLSIIGPVNLTGGGEVLLVDADGSIIADGGSGVLINTNNTIRGQGDVNVQLTNNHIIRAEGGTLSLGPTDNTNGQVVIASGGTLLSGTTSVTNAAQSGVVGGTVHGEANSLIKGNLTDVTLTGTVAVGPGGGTNRLSLTGIITNNGTLTFQSDPDPFVTSDGLIAIDDSATLTGSGELVLGAPRLDARVGSLFTTATLINDVDHTIRGSGTFTTTLDNNGTIVADGALRLTTTDNTDGIIEVASGGALFSGFSNLSTGGVSGGTITADPGGIVGGNLKDLTLAGTTVIRGDDTIRGLALQGNINNTGTIAFGAFGAVSGVSFATETLGIFGPVTLTGGGELVLAESDRSIVLSAGAIDGNAPTLINADNTIRGQGSITVPLENQSTVIAEGGTLSILGSSYTHIGDAALGAAEGATLDLGSSTNLTLNSGSLIGSGTIVVGSLTNNGAAVIPGASPGTLTIDGDYTHGPGATLVVEVAGSDPGQFDALNVLGNLDLQGGTLEVKLLTGLEEFISGGSTLDFINADSVSGSFSQVILPTDLDGNALFDASIDGGVFTLTATQDFAIPEPASLTLLAIGLAALSRRPQGGDAADQGSIG